MEDIYDYKIKTTQQIIAEVKVIKTMRLNIGMLMSIVAREVVENTTTIKEIKDEGILVSYRKLLCMCDEYTMLGGKDEANDTYSLNKLLAILEEYAGEVQLHKSNLEIEMALECKIYELSETKFYCSNKDLGKPYKTLGVDDAFTCPETYLFTSEIDGTWVLESLICVDEGRVKLFDRWTNKNEPSVAIIMTKCKLIYIRLANS